MSVQPPNALRAGRTDDELRGHFPASGVYRASMARSTNRVNVVLDKERATNLQRLAERTHTNPGTLTGALLPTRSKAVRW
jgi:hypothetical protein